MHASLPVWGPYALVAALFAFAVPLGCEAQASSAPAQAPVAAATHTLTLPVEGMVCGACQKAIQEEVGKLPGVVSCKASHKKEQVVVELSGTETDRARLAAVITELGYTVPASAEAATSAVPGPGTTN